MLKLKGSAHFRQRLVLATLAGRPLRIDDIRASDQRPGLRDFEANLLRLVEKITDGCSIEIDETGKERVETTAAGAWRGAAVCLSRTGSGTGTPAQVGDGNNKEDKPVETASL